MWESLGRPAEFALVEAGAGVGRFAAQVLDFCEAKLAVFYDALRYVAVERSASRRAQAGVQSKRHAAAGHFVASAEVPAHIAAGCLFSNELVDALPVHRVVMDSGALKETYVDFRDGRFTDLVAPLSTCAIAESFLALGKGNELADLYDEGQSEAERTKARLQLKTLIHPEGMGERFQVLIQQKGVSGAQLTGLSGTARTGF